MSWTISFRFFCCQIMTERRCETFLSAGGRRHSEFHSHFQSFLAIWTYSYIFIYKYKYSLSLPPLLLPNLLNFNHLPFTLGESSHTFLETKNFLLSRRNILLPKQYCYVVDVVGAPKQWLLWIIVCAIWLSVCPPARLSICQSHGKSCYKQYDDGIPVTWQKYCLCRLKNRHTMHDVDDADNLDI